jgi:hypothetical protein
VSAICASWLRFDLPDRHATPSPCNFLTLGVHDYARLRRGYMSPQAVWEDASSHWSNENAGARERLIGQADRSRRGAGVCARGVCGFGCRLDPAASNLPVVPSCGCPALTGQIECAPELEAASDLSVPDITIRSATSPTWVQMADGRSRRVACAASEAAGWGI